MNMSKTNEHKSDHNEIEKKPAPLPTPLKGRLLWFVTIWALSVAALGVISYLLRMILSVPF